MKIIVFIISIIILCASVYADEFERMDIAYLGISIKVQ